jgi:hypothetical protein
MQSLHQNLPTRDFPAQKNVQALTICPESGQLATAACPAPYTEYFVPGMALNPAQPCPIHTGVTPVVDPVNPRHLFVPGETVVPEATQPAEAAPAPECYPRYLSFHEHPDLCQQEKF